MIEPTEKRTPIRKYTVLFRVFGLFLSAVVIIMLNQLMD